MQINELPTIPQAPVDADVLAIEVDGVTYKVSKSVLASAILGTIDSAPTQSSENLVKSGGVYNAIAQSTASVNVTDKFTIASKYAGYIFQAYRTGKTVVITIVSEIISVADDDVVVTLNDLSLRPVGAAARTVAVVRVGTSVGMLFYNGDSNTFRLWISNATTGRLMTQIVYLIT